MRVVLECWTECTEKETLRSPTALGNRGARAVEKHCFLVESVRAGASYLLGATFHVSSSAAIVRSCIALGALGFLCWFPSAGSCLLVSAVVSLWFHSFVQVMSGEAEAMDVEEIQLNHASTTTDSQDPEIRWVDYLPNDDRKRASLDLTDTTVNLSRWDDYSATEDQVHPVSSVLLLCPHEHVQHELLLESTVATEDNSLFGVCHSLAQSMERSRETRQYLEKHIRQRANLAQVLSDIERSSRQVNEHVLTALEHEMTDFLDDLSEHSSTI